MPGATPPHPRFIGFECTGVLNEWVNPLKVDGGGLTDCDNIIYHREGTWGKRPGTTRVSLPQFGTQTPVSGFRWYRAFPNEATKLVIYEHNHILIGNDSGHLNDLGAFPLTNPNVAPDFCSIRDPQANGGDGADVLIITGLSLVAGGFGTGQITISGLPGLQPNGGYINVTITDGANSITTPNYYVEGSDNPDSIAYNLCQLINDSAAFLHKAAYFPFIGEAYFTSKTLPFGATDINGQPQAGSANPVSTIHLGARDGGNLGNNITYYATMSGSMGTGSTLAVSPTSPTNFTGGGSQWNGPCRLHFEEGIIKALSFMCPNPFAYCAAWHDHLWLWGDLGNIPSGNPGNPDTVFASDIYQPEAFTFMIQNGGMTAKTGGVNGGYTIGAGDGDSPVQQCLPAGNAFYIFKTASIYMIEGYDFQSSEYQFSVTPQVKGYGVPSRYCAAILEGQVVFWSGRKALRLAVGAYEPEHIGLPIPISEGTASAGFQPLVRVVAGDMQARTALNGQYQVGSGTVPFILRSLALFAVDFGSGSADTILVYDDEKSAAQGSPAWSKWTGLEIGAWIQYGAGPSPTGLNSDKPQINFVDSLGTGFFELGQSALSDYGNPIAFMTQSGWITGGTPETIKNVKREFIDCDTTAGASFKMTLIPGQIIQGAPSPWRSEFGTVPQTAAFSPTVAPALGEAINTMWQYENTGQQQGQLPIQANAFVVRITEDGTSFAGFEIRSYGLDIIEESLAT
jgi:hypothetical protein